jgi:hypothetical protein
MFHRITTSVKHSAITLTLLLAFNLSACSPSNRKYPNPIDESALYSLRAWSKTTRSEYPYDGRCTFHKTRYINEPYPEDVRIWWTITACVSKDDSASVYAQESSTGVAFNQMFTGSVSSIANALESTAWCSEFSGGGFARADALHVKIDRNCQVTANYGDHVATLSLMFDSTRVASPTLDSLIAWMSAYDAQVKRP